MVNEKIMLTEEGKKKYEEELSLLKNEVMRQVTQEIKEAKEQGDLSENADYDAARKKQGEVQARINYLDALLKNSEVLSSNLGDIIGLGTTVKLYFEDDDMVEEYMIVSHAEADPVGGKISNECELGKALIGHKEGEIVEVQGKYPYLVKIQEIVKTK